jgi:hypothetical protein
MRGPSWLKCASLLGEVGLGLGFARDVVGGKFSIQDMIVHEIDGIRGLSAAGIPGRSICLFKPNQAESRSIKVNQGCTSQRRIRGRAIWFSRVIAPNRV